MNNTDQILELQQESQRRIAPFKTKFPQLFSKLEWLETLEGWNNLVEQLSHALQNHLEEIPEELRDQVYFTQIKQKFGLLRTYLNVSTPFMRGVVSMAAFASMSICEQCGNAAGMRNINNWITTLCEEHYQQAITDKQK
jgi:hypothetical protein